MFNLQPKYGALEVRRNVNKYLANAWSIDNDSQAPGEPTAELTEQDGAKPFAFEKTSTQALHQAAISLVSLVMLHLDI